MVILSSCGKQHYEAIRQICDRRRQSLDDLAALRLCEQNAVASQAEGMLVRCAFLQHNFFVHQASTPQEHTCRFAAVLMGWMLSAAPHQIRQCWARHAHIVAHAESIATRVTYPHLALLHTDACATRKPMAVCARFARQALELRRRRRRVHGRWAAPFGSDWQAREHRLPLSAVSALSACAEAIDKRNAAGAVQKRHETHTKKCVALLARSARRPRTRAP